MLSVSIASASPVAKYITLGCCGSITRPLVPRTDNRSVRGCQLRPLSALDHKPPLAEQAKSTWLLVGLIATKFTRPILGSELWMLTGPRARQLETGTAAGTGNAKPSVHTNQRKAGIEYFKYCIERPF